MLNVSTLLGVRTSGSDALRYGLTRPGETAPRAASTRRPVVVWNVTRACNLACAHCYASAKRTPAPGELTTAEARAFLDDLAGFGVPAVLCSGGEPLVRADLLELVAHGTARGLRFTLSSNGTLIDDAIAAQLAAAGVVYVGISIDGAPAQHDRLRREEGAWQRSVDALARLRAAGVRRGVRFTLTPDTYDGLDAVLELVVRAGIERLCVYHLVPAGRGGHLDDLDRAQRRDALERIFDFAQAHPEVEVLTVDNPSDGPWLVRWLERRDVAAALRARSALAWNQGARNGAGIGLGCVDERGDVHPDQFSRGHVYGNVRETPFSQIWSAAASPHLAGLRSADRPAPTECGACADYALCGGGFRARAEAATGDPWGFDPSCVVRSA